jgi:hypothetical protein
MYSRHPQCVFPTSTGSDAVRPISIPFDAERQTGLRLVEPYQRETISCVPAPPRVPRHFHAQALFSLSSRSLLTLSTKKEDKHSSCQFFSPLWNPLATSVSVPRLRCVCSVAHHGQSTPPFLPLPLNAVFCSVPAECAYPRSTCLNFMHAVVAFHGLCDLAANQPVSPRREEERSTGTCEVFQWQLAAAHAAARGLRTTDADGGPEAP